MSLENTGFFVLAIFVTWLTMALFLGRFHTFIVKKGFSSARVGGVLIIVSIGLFVSYVSIPVNTWQKTLLILMIAGFLLGIGLIRMGNYKHLYGSDWEDKEK